MKMKEKELGMSAKNKRFWAMTDTQKRVAIAKDIIKQVEANKIKATSGTYIHLINLKSKVSKEDQALDKLFKEKGCKACALGSCFIALVDMGDKLKLSDITKVGEGARYDEDQSSYYYSELNDDDNWRPELRKIFSPKQLTLIESAFEDYKFIDDEDKALYSYESEHYPPDLKAAITFGKKYRSAKRRLIAICENTIKNKGVFKP